MQPNLVCAVRSPIAARRRYATGKGSSQLVLLGASTGGVAAIEEVLKDWPRDGPPMLVVQHMPGRILEHFVDRLDRACAPKVTFAFSGRVIEKGNIYVAPGGAYHMQVAQRGRTLVTDLDRGTPVSGHCPSVDILFRSALRIAPRVTAVLLTGMGRDGALGMKELRDGGAWTIAQDKATSIVHGMPGFACKIGAVVECQPLHNIARATLAAVAGPQSARAERS